MYIENEKKNIQNNEKLFYVFYVYCIFIYLIFQIRSIKFVVIIYFKIVCFNVVIMYYGIKVIIVWLFIFNFFDIYVYILQIFMY